MPRNDLQWLVLDDFTAGIQNNVLNVGNQTASQRLGAATEENTYRCIVLPTGGIGPLPRRTWNVLAGDYPVNPNPQVPVIYISGVHLTGPVLTSTADGPSAAALYIATEYQEDVAGDILRRWQVWQIGLWEDPFSEVQIDTYEATEEGGTQVRGTWFTDYRTQTSEDNESIAGYPVIVYSWYKDGGSTVDLADVWHMWPDPSDPSVNGYYDINAAEFPGGPYLSIDKTVGHQGRFVGLEQSPFFHGSATATWSSDEQIYFSRVNLQTLHSQQAAAFGYEKMTGFGAALSTSTDELFLVKHRGGGLTVNGDLENPSIVWLPGVVSTGGFSMQAAYTPVGAVYGVKGGGVYAWQGGDVSIKISPQLRDDFFLPADNSIFSGFTMENFNGYRGQFALWDDWIIAPNNWLFDSQSQSWWRLEDPDDYIFMYAQRDIVYNFLWTCPPAYDSDSDVVIAGYEKLEPAHNYSWQSQPVPQTMTQAWEVREMVLTAQGDGEVAIHLINQDGIEQIFIFTVTNSIMPVAQRITVDTTLAQHLQIRIVASGQEEDPSSPAPIVYDLKLGWRPHTHLPSEGVAEDN